MNPAVFIAKLLRKSGKTELSLWVLISGMRLMPGSVPLFREYFINRMATRDFDAIINMCTLLSRKNANTESMKNLATKFLARASLENDVPAEIFLSLRNKYRTTTSECLALLSGGGISEARKSFVEVLRLAGIPDAAKDSWGLAFDSFLPTTDSGSNDTSNLQSDPSVSKLVVSGMYWSGSGAIYDYLREFDQVAAIPGELRLWKEGDFCLNSLASRLKNGCEFQQALQRFLTIAVLGTGPVYNWQEEMAADYGLRAARNDTDGRYAQACRRFLESVHSLDSKKSCAENAFAECATQLTDDLTRMWGGTGKDLILYDNIVHIGNIEAVRFLGDATVFCAIRDPRSNFVARWYENPRFHRDVNRYISYYRNTLKHFELILSIYSEVSSKVKKVSFEHFIASEEYRDELAITCGLDLARRKKGRYFKPKLSGKNIINYQTFPDQGAIRKIEVELGQYCTSLPCGEIHGQ